MVKITLGWEVAYEFEVWIMPHHAGVDLILGTDFMIPAGIRLDLYNSTAKLPDEVVVPLIKSSRDFDETEYGREVIGGPPESLDITSRAIAQFKLRRRQPSESTHELWVRQMKGVIPTIEHNAKGRAVRVLLTNISSRLTWCPAHFPVIMWIPHGVLPRDEGYVRVNSAKYRDWQILAYEGALDNRLLKREQRLYMEWLSRQPPAVEQNHYNTPKAIQKRSSRSEFTDEAGVQASEELSEPPDYQGSSTSADRGKEIDDSANVPKLDPAKVHDDSTNREAKTDSASQISGLKPVNYERSSLSLTDEPPPTLTVAASDGNIDGEHLIGHTHTMVRSPPSNGKQKRCSSGMDRGDQWDPGEADSTVSTRDRWMTLPEANPVSKRLDPELVHTRVPRDFEGHVLSFDGSAKPEKYGGYGSCSWILWRLPNWDIVIAASAHLPSTTVNIAEYIGMNHGVLAAVDRGVTDLIIVGDSRLAIQQSMGVMACKKETLQVELARHKELVERLSSVRYLHVVRRYNLAADALATEALEAMAGRVILSGDRKTELRTLNRIQEKLYVVKDSTNEGEEVPKVSAITRSQAHHVRRVRFAEDELDDAANEPVVPDARYNDVSPNFRDAGSPDDVLEVVNKPPKPQRVAERGHPEHKRLESRSEHDIDPVVVQTEQRERVSATQDEKWKWPDL
ncbi:hypothetical protein PRIC2_006693 [Phytophthora ramorum]